MVLLPVALFTGIPLALLELEDDQLFALDLVFHLGDHRRPFHQGIAQPGRCTLEQQHLFKPDFLARQHVQAIHEERVAFGSPELAAPGPEYCVSAHG